MFKLHMTATGDQLLICQMKSNHLEAMILHLLRNIQETIQVMEYSDNVTYEMISAFHPEASLKEQKAKAKKRFVALNEKLYPYLAEAMLRGMSFTDEMNVIYKRDSEQPDLNMKQLPSHTEPLVMDVEEEFKLYQTQKMKELDRDVSGVIIDHGNDMTYDDGHPGF